MSIKKLAGQTMWYGLSSIAARFLNYLLTPYLTGKLLSDQFGEMSTVYAAIPFLNVVFTYGMETAYFRFVQKDTHRNDIYSTCMISMISSTVFLTGVLMLLRHNFTDLLKLQAHAEFVTYSIVIIALDALTTLPFAKLRQDNRPVKFAIIRILSISINILLIYFLISVLPRIMAANPHSFLGVLYIPEYGVGYVIIANVLASFITLLLLSKEFFSFRLRFNPVLWKRMIIYALPLLIAGFGGMINETFDRIMLLWWAPVSSVQEAETQVGIYSACYKLSLLITLFIQAFRMGAEPFFFKQAEQENPQRVYARVMKFFVITITVMFLLVVLYLDIWKYFIQRKSMWVGLKVVPVLLLANMFLGIYYNLAIWYKITQKTIAGAYITIIGAVITIIINYFFIPYFSYMACAWATFACYGSMMVVSFIWGQKEYHVPYAWKKLSAYIIIVVLLFFMHHSLIRLWTNRIYSLSLATAILFLYIWFIANVEKKEIQKLPVVGKLFRKPIPVK